MNKVAIHHHNGTEIVVMDYSHCKTAEEMMAVSKESMEFASRLALGKGLGLSDMTNCYFDKEVVAALQDSAKTNAPFFKASAVVGVKGLMKVILPVIDSYSGRNYKVFETRKEAMDWLASQI